MKLKSTVPAAIAATCLMTQPALAYHFSPTQIRSVISGKMTLTPTGGGQPFICQVQMNLRTHSQTNVPQIERVKTRGAGFCRDSGIPSFFMSRKKSERSQLIVV